MFRAFSGWVFTGFLYKLGTTGSRSQLLEKVEFYIENPAAAVARYSPFTGPDSQNLPVCDYCGKEFYSRGYNGKFRIIEKGLEFWFSPLFTIRQNFAIICRSTYAPPPSRAHSAYGKKRGASGKRGVVARTRPAKARNSAAGFAIKRP